MIVLHQLKRPLELKCSKTIKHVARFLVQMPSTLADKTYWNGGGLSWPCFSAKLSMPLCLLAFKLNLHEPVRTGFSKTVESFPKLESNCLG